MPQRVVFHKSLGYVRDTDPVMKPEPDGFELRVETGSVDSLVMTRPEIYRYQVTAEKAERIQPIAMNGRDFVDEWLESPWPESKNWVASTTEDQLGAMHKKDRGAPRPEGRKVGSNLTTDRCVPALTRRLVIRSELR